MSMTETIIAELKAVGLEAFEGTMASAGKSTEQVGAGATSAAKDTEEAATGIKASGGKMLAGLALAAGGAVAAKKAFGFMKSAADDAMTLTKSTIQLSRTTGLDSQTSSEWVSMAKERGISTDKLQVALGSMSRKLNAAGQGSKAASKIFQQLGLDSKEMISTDPSTRLLELGDAFKAMPAGANKTALAMQLFGRSGRNLLPIMNLGASGILEQTDAMKKYGLTVGGKGVKSAKDLIAEQREMQAAMEGVKIQIGTALIPIMGQLAKILVPVMQAFNQAVIKWPALVPIVIGLTAAFGGLMIIGSVAGAVTAILPLLPMLATGFEAAWAAATGPVGLVVLAVAAVAAGFVVLYKKVGWFHDGVDAVFGWIKGHWPLLLGILTGPFGLAVEQIITHFGQIKTGVSNVVSAVVKFFTSLPGKVAGVGRQIATTILNGIKSLPGDAANIGKQIVQAIISGIQASPGAIISAVKGLVPGPLKSAISFLTGATGTIVAAATGHAHGATSTTLVGENGPEIAEMPSGTRITPLPPPMLRPSQIGGTSGQQPIVTQVFLDRKQIAQAFGSYAADVQAAR